MKQPDFVSMAKEVFSKIGMICKERDVSQAIRLASSELMIENYLMKVYQMGISDNAEFKVDVEILNNQTKH